MPARQLIQAMPARQSLRVTSDPARSPNKLLLLVSLGLALGLAEAVGTGTDHPSNDTHPRNSGGLDVHLDLARNETYLPVPNDPKRVCTVPYCTVKSSQCASQENYTCYPPEEDCRSEAHMRVFCYGYNKGYIHIPTKPLGSTKQNPADSCVTLEIPADHVAMISFAGNLSCEPRTLTAHRNAACQGEGEHMCFNHIHPIKPRLYDLRAVSFRFRTASGLHPDYSFSILYSFHNGTAKPEKLKNNRWNCSVPYLSQFQDHFMCNADNLCKNSRDIDRCRTDADICGVARNFWRLHAPGRCYYVFQNTMDEAWNFATHRCSQLGGRMLTPDSTFLEMTKNLSDGYIFVGKRKPFVPDMYRNTWVWEDDSTLAVHSKLTASAGQVEDSNALCSLVTKRGSDHALRAIYCRARFEKPSYVCDLSDPASRDGKSDTNALLPTLDIEPTDEPFMVKDLLQMAWCDDNHTVHAFQACDATTGCLRTSTKAGRSCADSRFSSPMPFFTCDTKSQDVPYSMVCDFREDCSDGSDENFCRFQPCRYFYQSSCKNKQCIDFIRPCDMIADCSDGSDEWMCGLSGQEFERGLQSIQPPAKVDWMRSYWLISRLNYSNFSCPATHFHCPGYKVCLPVYVLCNGVNDCPDKQDEAGCDHFKCPGFYRCRSSKICLHFDHLCDGVVQCPHHDDELMCDDKPCPDACVCYGYAFTCTGEFDADLYRNLRYLDASGSGMTLAAVSKKKTLLIHLSLRHCGITVIGKVKLPNLQRLDLSHNLVTYIAAWELNQLGNLRYLSLAYNPVSLHLDFLSDANHEFPLIRELSFAGLNIPLLNETFALRFPNIEELNLSESSLKLLPKSGFRSFERLHVLDIRKCQLQTGFAGMFGGLVELEAIHAEDFKICCPSALPAGFNPKDCHAPANEVSSCGALLRSEAFRVFLVLYALFSLLGNLGSFVYRVIVDRSDVAMGFDVFVTHLSVADFLMGVYLAIIGVADRIFYGDYVWHDTEWRHSTPCLIAGFLSFLSSEVSVFLVCFITLERLLVIRFPLKNLRFSRRTAHIICVALWIVGVTLSAVPLFPSLKHWEFYSQYGICIPLPVTRKTFPGMDYAFGVMIGLNFVIFVCIAVGQGLIYHSFRSNTMTGQNRATSKDITIAYRLLAVVLTDFLCWFPIGLLGILARSDVSIPGEVNVGMAIFVLPFNSALNPFLYTVIVALERRRKTRGRRLTKAEKKERFSSSQALENIDTWLTENVISIDHLQKYSNKGESEQTNQTSTCLTTTAS